MPSKLQCAYQLAVIVLFGLTLTSTNADNNVAWQAGLSRVDVTPKEPVRMSGYGNRDHANEGIDTPLFVRCLALQSDSDDGQPSVLISVDTIGLPGSMTDQLANKVLKTHGIARQRLVFCSTHTHCGPDLLGQLSNIFAEELSTQEIAAGERYKRQLEQGILSAIDLALADLSPARLAYGAGEVTFAANRRVLTDGRWTGFGVQADGPVDHAVPVLRVADRDDKIRGIVFNYACHCTTLGGNHYNINGDWAGYAATNLESAFDGAVALCTIGCGGDANPEPRATLDATKIHGRSMSAEVRRIVNGPMQAVGSGLQPRFDHVELHFDLPTRQSLQQQVSQPGARPQVRRHAQRMLETLDATGQLPATYAVPIQSWRLGDQLTMVFLGGEVVVDYALRLKETLGNDLWVTAYANDVLGYIASERMRAEGGYEYDFSGIYYSLPGPWATGTENRLVEGVVQLLQSSTSPNLP